jgi:hypothetical protein
MSSASGFALRALSKVSLALANPCNEALRPSPHSAVYSNRDKH